MFNFSSTTFDNFSADDITITDILSIFLSLVGFLISYTTYFAGERENRDFQIDFYNFMLQLLDENHEK